MIKAHFALIMRHKSHDSVPKRHFGSISFPPVASTRNRDTAGGPKIRPLIKGHEHDLRVLFEGHGCRAPSYEGSRL